MGLKDYQSHPATRRTAALHEWCSVEVYAAHPGASKRQLCSHPLSLHLTPSSNQSSSVFVCFIYWSHWEIFV